MRLVPTTGLNLPALQVPTVAQLPSLPTISQLPSLPTPDALQAALPSVGALPTVSRSRNTASVLLVVMQLIFAVWNLLAGGIAGALSSVRFCTYRTGLTSLLLIPVWHLKADGQLPVASDVPRVVVVGTVGIFGTMSLFLLGLSGTSPSTASLYMPLVPVLTAALSVVLRYEPYRPGMAVPLGLAAGGALCVVTGSIKPSTAKASADMQAGGGGTESVVGHICLVGSALCQAVYLLWSRPIVLKYPSVAVTTWLFIIGACEFIAADVLDVTGPGSGNGATANSGALKQSVVPSLLELSELPTAAARALAFAVVGATVINYNIIFHANSVLPSSSVSLFSCLQPLFTCALAWAVHGKRLSGMQAAGGVLVVLGMWLTLQNAAAGNSSGNKRKNSAALGSGYELIPRHAKAEPASPTDTSKPSSIAQTPVRRPLAGNREEQMARERAESVDEANSFQHDMLAAGAHRHMTLYERC